MMFQRLVILLLVMLVLFAVLICDGNAEEVVVTSAEKLSRITFSENCWATEISAGVQTFVAPDVGDWVLLLRRTNERRR